MSRDARPAPAVDPPPAAGRGPHDASWHGVLCFAAFAVFGLVLFSPALLGGEYVLPGTGSQDSDVVRGAWSLGQLAWGLPDPIFTERVYFPVGVKALPLPFASGLLLAPVNLLLGPLSGYDISVVLLLAALGWSTAWLGREITGSWGLGAIAAGAVLAQPMLMHAISDGTPEHLALWSLPAAAAAACRAWRSGRLRWAPLCGLLCLLLLLDSPYMAVYGLVLAPFLLAAMLTLPRQRQDGWLRRLRPLAACAACALPAVLLVAWLYSGFSLAPQDFTVESAAVELAGNSVELRSWWALQTNPASDVRGNLVPALVPTAMLLPALILALVGLPRSLPWLLASLAMLALAMGINADNSGMLAWWLREPLGEVGQAAGRGLGDAVLAFNRALLGQAPFTGIRFPRRWLLPAALCLALAGSIGLGRLLRLGPGRWLRRVRGPWPRTAAVWAGLLVGPLLAAALLSAQPYLHPRSTTRMPQLAFADWIRARPGSGAVIAFPTVRPGPPNTHRWELPVYANISDAIRSADCLYFQLVHRRPVLCYPALFTVTANQGLDETAARLVRDTNDLALPGMTGQTIPPSALEAEGATQRARGRDWLADRGLRWVTLDLAVYPEAQVQDALVFYEPVAEVQRFDDGDGVLVIELER